MLGRRPGGKADGARPCPDSRSILAFQETPASLQFLLLCPEDQPASLQALGRAELPPQKDDPWRVDCRALRGKRAGSCVDRSLTFKYLDCGTPWTLRMLGAALKKKCPAQTLAHSRAQTTLVLVDGGRWWGVAKAPGLSCWLGVAVSAAVSWAFRPWARPAVIPQPRPRGSCFPQPVPEDCGAELLRG